MGGKDQQKCLPKRARVRKPELTTKSEEIRPSKSGFGEAKQGLLSLKVTQEVLLWNYGSGYHNYLSERNPSFCQILTDILNSEA